MRLRALVAALALAGAALAGPAAAPSAARAVDVPVDAAALRSALAAAAPGDTLRLGAGTYAGSFESTVPVVLLGHPGSTVFDGGGKGTVLTLRGGACTVADLVIRHGGESILREDAGLHLVTTPGSVLERLVLDDVLHGIYLERAGGTIVRDVRFTGKSGRVSEANNGNAVHLWYSPGVLVERCDVSGHRDGMYISFCKNVTIRDSRFHRNDRYGLHYMYSDSNVVENSRFEQNVAGAAIMFSHRLLVVGNRFRDNADPRAYGLLLRDCNDGRFEHNEFEGNTIAIFLDGAQRDTIRYNRIADNDWGLSLFASSRDVVFERNDLIGNRFQVATDLRRDPNHFRDNYWDDARGYDLDGDGRADRPHRPVALFAFLSKRYPDLALFAASPAVAALTAAERTLPALAPSEIADESPAMRPWTTASRDADDPRRGRPSWPLAAGSTLVGILGGTALWRLGRS